MDYLSCLLSCHLTDCIREALAEPGTLRLLKKEFSYHGLLQDTKQ